MKQLEFKFTVARLTAAILQVLSSTLAVCYCDVIVMAVVCHQLQCIWILWILWIMDYGLWIMDIIDQADHTQLFSPC